MVTLKIILLALALVFARANADAQELIARNEGDHVRLTQRACPQAVLKLLKADVHEHYRLADVLGGGIAYAACWRLRPDMPAVLVVFDDGDYLTIPLAEFTQESGT